MPTFDTPGPISAVIDLVVGDARITASDRDDDLRSQKPAQSHARTLAMTSACSGPAQPQIRARRHLGAMMTPA